MFSNRQIQPFITIPTSLTREAKTPINTCSFCINLKLAENFLHAKESATLTKMSVAPHYIHRLFCFFQAGRKKKITPEMKDILFSPTSSDIHNPVCPRLPRCRNTSQGCVETRHTRARPRSRPSSTLAPSPPLATLHAKKQPFAPTLTESVNMRSENEVTRGSFFRFCLMIHDSVIYGPTPLTLSLLQYELHNPRISEIRC